MDKGWVSIHRKILKNPILKMNRSYSRFEAWIYLLLRATYNNQKVVLGSDIYELKSGEILTSQKKLCKQFKWGNSRLRTFLKLLQKDGMINVKTNSKLTHLTILNYNKLQRNQIATKSLTNHNQIHSNKENKTNKDIYTRIDEFKKQCEELLPAEHDEYENFINYYTEYNDGGKKFKKEFYKTFNIKMRWNTWLKNDFGSNNKQSNKNLDNKYPLDKTERSRKCRCTKCNGIDLISAINPNLEAKSNFCKAPIKPYEGE